MAQTFPAARTIQNLTAEVECHDCQLDDHQPLFLDFTIWKHVPLGPAVNTGLTCTTGQLTDDGGPSTAGKGVASCTSGATFDVAAGDELFVEVKIPLLLFPSNGRYGDLSLRWAFEAE